MIFLSFCLDLAIVVLSAVGVQLHFSQFGWSMFQYYTLDSNVFLLLACAIQAWYEGGILLRRRLFVPSWVRMLKYLAVCTVMVTFFVVIFILVPMAGGLAWLPYSLFHGAMLYHHTLCPLLGVLSFLFLDRASLPDRRVTLWALAPTALYAAVSIVLNALSVLHGPYPFLYVHEQPVWMSALWCAVILALAWCLAFLVWKLSLRFSAPREAPEQIPAERAWTADGYLQDQDALGAYTYRTIPASSNACGPVAAFNLRRHEGHAVQFVDVLTEMDALHFLCVPGPTFMYAMRRYLSRYLPGWREIHGRSAALAAAERSRMGIIRYHEQMVPHFVSFYRLADGRFRFLNIWDGMEDVTLSMPDFGREHLLGGSVKLFYWE